MTREPRGSPERAPREPRESPERAPREPRESPEGAPRERRESGERATKEPRESAKRVLREKRHERHEADRDMGDRMRAGEVRVERVPNTFQEAAQKARPRPVTPGKE